MWLREGQQHLLSSSQIHQAKQHSPSTSDGLLGGEVGGTMMGEKRPEQRLRHSKDIGIFRSESLLILVIILVLGFYVKTLNHQLGK